MLNRNPNNPIISVIGTGPRSYIWVGNNATGDMACFATIAGKTRLRQLSNAILKAIGET